MNYSANKKTSPIATIIFGILFVCAGLYVGKMSLDKVKEFNNKTDTFVEINSKVVGHTKNNDGKEAVIVEYTVDGVRYKEQSNKYSNDYVEIGTEVKIKYNPNNPQEVIWGNEKSDNMIFTIASGILVVFGGYLILNGFANCFTKEVTVTYHYNIDDKGPNDHEKYQMDLQKARQMNQNNNQNPNQW